MSQDYTVAKELASLKEIKQSAEQRISDLSLNALNYVNDHRLHKSGGGGGSDLGFDWDFFIRSDIREDAETGDIIFENVQLLAGDYDKFKEKMNSSEQQEFYIGALGINPDSSEPATASMVVPLRLYGIHGDPGIIYFMVRISPSITDNPYAWWYPDNTVTIENERPSNSQRD